MLRKILHHSLLTILYLWLAAGHAFAQQHVSSLPPERVYQQAVDLLSKQHYGAARQLFAQLLEEYTDQHAFRYADLRYYLLVCAVETRDPHALAEINLFREEARGSDKMHRADFLEGRMQFAQRRYSQALAAFRKVKRSELPDFEQAELDYKTGFCLIRQNQVREAIPQLERVLQTSSVYAIPARYQLAHLHYSLANNQQALELFAGLRNEPAYRKIVPVYELQLFYRQGMYDEAIAVSETAMASADSRQQAEIARIMANIWFSRNDCPKALSYLTVVEKNPRRQLSAQDHYQAGKCKLGMQDYKEAIRHLQQASAGEEAFAAHAAYLLAHAYAGNGQKVFARNAFLAAYRKNGNTETGVDALLNYARLSLETEADPFNEAATLLEKYLNSSASPPRAAEAGELLVQQYLQGRNYDAALASLERNKAGNPRLHQAYAQLTFNIGAEYLRQNNPSAAEPYFNRLANLKPATTFNTPALFWLAETKYQQKNFVDAVRLYRQMLAARDAQSSGLVAKAHYGLGYSHFQLKQYDQALQAFSQFLSMSGNDPAMTWDAWLRTGDCHFISRRYERAIEAYDRVVNAGIAEADYALMQKALAQGALSRHNQKIATLDQLLKRFPRSSYYDQALYEMASTSLVTNDKRAALAYFDQLIRERPRSAYAREAMLKTGLIYFNNDQPEQAIQHLRRVAETYPGTPDAREALNTLKVIYMETNMIDEFFKFAQSVGMGSITVSEQDSLTFITAENFYTDGRFDDASIALDNYLSKFPNGAYLLKANYYKARILLRANNRTKALPHLEFLAGVPNNPYLSEALLHLARHHYDAGNYGKAADYYSRLYESSGQQGERLEAIEGKMKSHFFEGKYDEALRAAGLLSNADQAKPEQKLHASYISGKSYLELGNSRNALEELGKVHRSGQGVMAAEACYLIARIQFDNNQLTEAENTIFELAEKYKRHDYWVAKGFILLADIYVKTNNIFQAKATLQSIIDNYPGEDLRQEARRKLNMLK
ncbi:MAG: tetratricopeptide repeat protein [Bacteroidetes bacterium]|nr:tetratricopeptide repeat protein [Bacteroidota bacterium]